MRTIVSTMPFSSADRERIRSMLPPDCQICFLEPATEREEYRKALTNAEVLLGDPTLDDLALCSHLRLLQTTWAGVDGYVANWPLSRNVTLCNMSGAYGPIISEYILGMIFALCTRLPFYTKQMEHRVWHLERMCKSLEYANVLILGAGDIGSQVAKRLRPSVKTIIGLRRTPREIPAEFDRMITMEDLDAALEEADVVVCSLPLTAETYHLLDFNRLKKMKRDAILVNVGRGGLIASDDLAELMKQGWFFGVGLDVTEPEPLPKEDPLWNQERVLITPHISGNAFDFESPTGRRILEISMDNLYRYLHGQSLVNVVDFDKGYRASGEAR